MIFVNLLPDIKLQFLRARRYRRILVSIAFITIPACLVLCALLAFWAWHNPSKIDALEEENQAIVNESFNEEEIRQILTLQSQVESLEVLHEGKTNPENLVSGPNYLESLIPFDSSYESVVFDFANGTFEITGKTDSLISAQRLRETIELVGYVDCFSGDHPEANRDTRLYPFRVDSFPTPQVLPGVEDRLPFTVTGRFARPLFDSQEPARKLFVPSLIVNPDIIYENQYRCHEDPASLEWTDRGGDPQQTAAPAAAPEEGSEE